MCVRPRCESGRAPARAFARVDADRAHRRCARRRARSDKDAAHASAASACARRNASRSCRRTPDAARAQAMVALRRSEDVAHAADIRDRCWRARHAPAGSPSRGSAPSPILAKMPRCPSKSSCLPPARASACARRCPRCCSRWAAGRCSRTCSKPRARSGRGDRSSSTATAPKRCAPRSATPTCNGYCSRSSSARATPCSRRCRISPPMRRC